MGSQRQKRRMASVKRHEISRLQVAEGHPNSDDRVRFLKLAAIALDGPDERPEAEQGADHEGLISIRQWNNTFENTRRARALLHYVQN